MYNRFETTVPAELLPTGLLLSSDLAPPAQLQRCEQLFQRNQHRSALRGLTELLESTPGLDDRTRQHAEVLRVRVFMAHGLDRRAWKAAATLPPSPESRLLQAELWKRNAPPARARKAVLALARAHPSEAGLWQLVEDLTPPDFDVLGYHHEVVLGLAHAPDADPRWLCRAAEVLARGGAGAEAEALLDRLVDPSPDVLQRALRIRARIRFQARDREGLAALLDQLHVQALPDALELHRFHLAAGQLAAARAVLWDARPTPIDPTWLHAATVFLCRTGAVDEAAQLVDQHGTPGDDAHVVLWATRGDHDAIRQAPAPASAPPSRRILEAEAWLDLDPDKALDLITTALDDGSDPSPTLALHNLRFGPSPLRLAVVRAGLAPFLPATFDHFTPERQYAWLVDHTDRILGKLGPGRDEFLIWTDPHGTLQVHHPPVDTRLQLALIRGGLLDLGFASVLRAYDDWRDRHGAPPLWYTYRAEVVLWSGELVGARADLEAALALDPRTRWAYVGLALVCLAERDYEGALAILAEGTTRLGPITSGWPVAAEALFRLGRLAEGLAELNRAVEHRPHRLSIRVVEALYALAEGTHPHDLIAAIARTYPRLWAAAAGDTPEARLEAILTMMGANRSSSTIVWRHPEDGWCLTATRPLR